MLTPLPLPSTSYQTLEYSARIQVLEAELTKEREKYRALEFEMQQIVTTKWLEVTEIRKQLELYEELVTAEESWWDSCFTLHLGHIW